MSKTNGRSDVVGGNGGWLYSDKVKEHFFNPRNFVVKGEPTGDYNGVGMVGNPACGDMMRVWIKVDPESERIRKCVWQTFGCASAIAATSAMSEMVSENEGMLVDDALALDPNQILDRLGGLPARKVHCSVLGDKALRAAINDYFRRSNQEKRIIEEGARIVDKVLKITDKDIENAVKNGAKSVSQVQEETKVGSGDPTCLPQVEQLVRFYNEKYSGER